MPANDQPIDQPIDQTPEWAAVEKHAAAVRDEHLRDLFAADPERGPRFTYEAEGLVLDLSKNRITAETLQLLIALAEKAGLRERIRAMFAGEHINVTEDRAVMHVALRAPRDATLSVDGENVVPAVHEVLDKMAAFADRVRSGEWTGFTGRRIRAVVNIGIGGSDLGPVHGAPGVACTTPTETSTCRFVSNVDPAPTSSAGDRATSTRRTTLFIVASKTFTTLETLTNATAARQLAAGRGSARTRALSAQHFVAVSTNGGEGGRFRHRHRRTCSVFWDWVGGRYSVDSAIGLSVMCHHRAGAAFR